MDFKKTGYLLTLSLLILGAIAFYFHDAPSAENITLNQTTTQPLKNDASNTEESIEKTAAEITTNNKDSNLTPEDVLEFVKWQHQHGYPSLDQHGELLPTGYENYTKETLNTLANEGDARAMLILGTQHMLSANFDVAEKYFLDASIRGYTFSLGQLANVKFLQAKRSLKTSNMEASNSMAEEAFAWLEVGLMRGDKALLFNKSTYALSFPQNETARQRITDKASMYYEQLSQDRIQLGLGEFDNTSPKAMDAIFSQ